jgi:hypothetical protein
MNEFMTMLENDNSFEALYKAPVHESMKFFVSRVKEFEEFVSKDFRTMFGRDYYGIIGSIQNKSNHNADFKVDQTLKKRRNSYSNKFDRILADRVFYDLTQEFVDLMHNAEKKAITTAFLTFKNIVMQKHKNLFYAQTKPNTIAFEHKTKACHVTKINIDGKITKNIVTDIVDCTITHIQFSPLNMRTGVYGYLDSDPTRLLLFDEFLFHESNYVYRWKITPWQNYDKPHNYFHDQHYRVNTFDVCMRCDEYMTIVDQINTERRKYIKAYTYLKSHFVDKMLINGMF